MIKLDGLNDLFQKEISRKEFLRYVGVAFLSLIGVAAVLQNIQGSLGELPQKQPKKEIGYGSSPYGR